jgi:DNA polymerase-3 subunit alpha
MDLIPDFIDRKKGRKKVSYLHPLLEEASKETFGILIYQEQVQRAANLLAGYSLGEADLLRRAMGKKKLSEMVKQRKKFVEGCATVNKIPEKQANQIFDLLEKFAGYGFNKSHSAAYGLISYQTAFLKANYPVEFMAALLSNEINNTDKISIFVAECQRMGIEILAPDVNRSLLKFAPEKKEGEGKAIRFGLAAIKNVGGAAMAKAIEEREANGPFASLEEFATRLDTKVVNRKILENLIKGGAFDFTLERRDEMFSRVGQVVASSSANQRDKATGQGSLFDMEEMMAAAPPPELSDEDRVEWSEEEYLTNEKELLGFYVTGHPLDKYRATIEGGKFKKLGSIQQFRVGGKHQFAGIIGDASVRYTKRESKPFAILLLEDFTGQTEVMVWNEVFEKRGGYIEKGAVIALTAKIEEDSRTEMKRLTAQDIVPLKIDPNAVASSKSEPSPEGIAATAPSQQGRVGDSTTQSASGGGSGQTAPHGNANGNGTAAHHQAPAGPPIVLKLDCITDTSSSLEAIKAAAVRYPGTRPLHFRVRRTNGLEVTLAAGAAFGVSDGFAEADEVRGMVSVSA